MFVRLCAVLCVLAIIAFCGCSEDEPTPSSPAESISVPTIPTGPDSVEAARQANYCSGDAQSSMGHSLEYRFDLGTGVNTDWSNSTCADLAWTTSGSKWVRAQARCVTHTDRVSQWSESLAVHAHPREVVVPPSSVGTDRCLAPDQQGEFTSYGGSSSYNHPLEFRFDWGDGILSAWSDARKDVHQWSVSGIYTVRSQTRCATHNDVLSGWTGDESAIVAVQELLWSLPVGAGYSTPAVGADGTLYMVGSPDRILNAINPGGWVEWSYSTSAGFATSPIVDSDGTIYVAGNNSLIAVHPSGVEKWTYRTDGYGTPPEQLASAPAIDAQGTVYVPSNMGKLYAISTRGNLKWSYSTGDDIDDRLSLNSPSIGADGTVYLVSTNWDIQKTTLQAIDTDGKLLWKYAAGSQRSTSPAIDSDGTLYFGIIGGVIAVRSDGNHKWFFRASNYVGTEPLIGSDGLVYVAHGYNVYALSGSGTLVWSETMEYGDLIQATPTLVSDGSLYVLSARGQLFSVRQGSMTSLFQSCAGHAGWRSSPVIGADGSIYFTGPGGLLYAITGTELSQVGPWPLFRHDAMHTGRAGGP